jgi:hypothetical protein
MQAWIDDSGADLTSRVFVYAGFLSPASRWQGFSEEWEMQLREPPQIAYFKMHEASVGQGQFSNWTHSATNRKIETLVKVICKHAESSLFATMSMGDYQGAIREPKRVPRSIDFPQFLSFHGLVAGTLRKFQRYIDFFFDEDKIHEHRILECWELVKQVIPPDIADFLQPQPLFCDDKKFKPLQAADMLAWNMRKMASGESDSWQWIGEGLSSIPCFTLEIDASKLESFTRSSPNIFDPKLWAQFDSSDKFGAFDRTMRELMSVPHSEIKAELDAEKSAKKKKRKALKNGRVRREKL